MNNHTSSLFHYTKQREYLVEILKNGLYPNYCKEQYLGIRNEEIIGIPMVCFCDIPIMRVQAFSKDYGKFAIAFSKSWALKNEINPVFYVQEMKLKRILTFFRTVEKYFSEINQTNKDDITFAFNLFDKQHLNKFADLVRSIQTKYANDTLLGYIKPYKTKDDKGERVNYIENEWRYIITELKGVKWLRGEDKYKEWRGNPKGPKRKAPKEILEKKLTFSVDDITYLITKTEEDTMRLLLDIQKLKFICGTRISELDKFKLINKIISFEKIENDF